MSSSDPSMANPTMARVGQRGILDRFSVTMMAASTALPVTGRGIHETYRYRPAIRGRLTDDDGIRMRNTQVRPSTDRGRVLRSTNSVAPCRACAL